MEELNKHYLSFRLSNQQQKLEIIKTIFVKEKAEIFDGLVRYEKDNKVHLVLLALQFDMLSENNYYSILEGVKSSNADIIEIVCVSTTPNLNTHLLSNKQIEFITREKLSHLLLEHNIKKDTSLNFSATKLSYKQLLKTIFAPNKTKSYFWCGLILLFSSIILPYHTYYLIVGSMLMLFTIICKLLPKS